MAATIARAIGVDKSRRKEAHRLGHEESWVQAATWRTFASATIDKNGRGTVEVVRDGKVLHTFDFGPEEKDLDKEKGS